MLEAARPQVRHLRQVLLWPLRLMLSAQARAAGRSPWQLLTEQAEASPWAEVVDEFTGVAGSFQERRHVVGIRGIDVGARGNSVACFGEVARLSRGE